MDNIKQTAPLDVGDELKGKAQKEKPKKKEKEEYRNTYIYGLIFIITSLLLEAANFICLGLGVFPINFGIELSIIIMLAGVIFIVPTRAAKIIICTLFVGLQFALNIANASLFKMVYDIVTVDMIFTLGFETADVFSLDQLDTLNLIFSAIILLVYVLAIFFGNKYAPKFKIKKNKSAIVSLVLLLLSVEMIGFSSLNMSKFIYFNNAEAENIVDDNEYWYTSMNNKFASMQKYGFWNFYINNLGVFLNYQSKLTTEEMTKLTEYVEAGENHIQTGSTFNKMNVSSSLAGDNLIVIMMESMEWFGIDEYNTPNLYDFVNNDAIAFTNFYSNNKTNISEQISLMGSTVNTTSLKTINNNVGLDVTYSLPNLFKENGGESTTFLHDYVGKYYHRDVLNKVIGFDNFYSMENYQGGFNPDYFGDFLDDGEFMKEFINQAMPTNKQFFTYFTTVTTHGPYENSTSRYQQYYDRFENNYESYIKFVEENNLGYLTPEKNTKEYKLIKEYKSRAMALDNAINVILNYLKTHYNSNRTSLYDNTTIVLFADHNACYSDLTSVVKGIEKHEHNNQLYNVPFVLFNKSLGNGKIDDFCNTYDIYPTICDLYGFEYNKNLVQGYSVFSNEIKQSVFVSSKSGIFDNYYYTVTLNDFSVSGNSLEDNARYAEFKNKLNNFYKKQDMIEKYYKINYSKYAQ